MFISPDFVDGYNDNIRVRYVVFISHAFVVDGCNDNIQMSKICHVYFT